MRKKKLLIAIIAIVASAGIVTGVIVTNNYMEEKVYFSENDSLNNNSNSDGEEIKKEFTKSDAKEKAKKILSEIYNVDADIDELLVQRNGITYQLNEAKEEGAKKTILKYKIGDEEERYLEVYGGMAYMKKEECEKKLKKKLKECQNIDLDASNTKYELMSIDANNNEEEYKKVLKDTWQIFYDNNKGRFIVIINVKNGEVLEVQSDRNNGRGELMDLKTKREDVNEVLSPLLKEMNMNIDDYEISGFDVEKLIFVNKENKSDVFTAIIDNYRREVIRINRSYKPIILKD